MKKRLHVSLFALLILGLTPLAAQLDILLVDDSDDGFSNTANLETGLTDAGYSYTLYDAVDVGMGPDLLTMEAYDLVIWHTSTDGGELHLWNADETVNSEITSYLDGGGNMWVIGHDFLFDRYGSPPVSFMAGDFEFDYLGIEEFAVESYTDDGEVGVPFMTPVGGQPITGLADVDFIFSTLWYADGVTPTADGISIYMMGDDSYIFYETPTAVWHDKGNAIILTYFFDLSLGSEPTVISENMGAVLDFFDAAITSVENPFGISLQAQIAPNPASTIVNLDFNLEEATELDIQVMNIQGIQVGNLADGQRFTAGQQNIQWEIPSNLASGIYLVSITDGVNRYAEILEVIR